MTQILQSGSGATGSARGMRHAVLSLAALTSSAAVLLGVATPVLAQSVLSHSVLSHSVLAHSAGGTGPAVAAKTGTVAARRAAARALAARRAKARLAPKNVAMSPNVLASCTAVVISASCVAGEIAAINNARAIGGIAPLAIDEAKFAQLSAPEQVFAITDLERSARGLPVAVALTAQLNAAAASGSAKSVDPTLVGWTLAGNKFVTSWASNWAGGLDALGSDYIWMYDDGVGYNLDCPSAGAAGCWGHRSNILLGVPSAASCAAHGASPELVMGAAVLANGYKGGTGIGELFVTNCGGMPADVVYTWAQAQKSLFS